mgnify:CR=1 FL=1
MNTTTIVAASDIDLGNVVTIRSNARRFVVVDIDRSGSTTRYNLCALSGGYASSAPSSMARADLHLSADQSVVFLGKEATKRQVVARNALSMTTRRLDRQGLFTAITLTWK